jgi:cellulose synthase/poly-beta-1,6-N-acetylglucosamine synthase-like glycosyltransferase
VSRAKNFPFSQSKSRTSGNKAESAIVLVREARNRGWRLSKAVAASFLGAKGYFLVFVLNFTITFEVVGSSKAGLDTKMFIESTYRLGRKLWIAIREDFLWNFVEMEDIPIVKISSTLSC